MPHLLRRGYGEFGHRIGIGPAQWPHHDFLFVHRGHVSLEFPALARSLSLAAGQGVLIWPHTEFRGQARRGRVRASIQPFRVEGDGDGPFAPLADQQRGFRVTRGGPSDWLNRCVDRLQRAEGPVRVWLLAVILAEGGLLSAAGAPAGDTRIDLASLREWTRTQLARGPGVGDLAARVGLSPSRFRAVFKTEHGLSAGTFLRAVRTAEAQRLLAETQEPIKAVAGRLGLADTVVFCRTFKRDTGQTPARFRRAQRISG